MANKINFSELPLDSKIELSYFLDSLRTARQIAYNAAKLEPSMHEWFEEVEAIYHRFATCIDADAKPVFDAEAHKAKKLAEGDRIYTEAYGPEKKK